MKAFPAISYLTTLGLETKINLKSPVIRISKQVQDFPDPVYKPFLTSSCPVVKLWL